MYVDPTVYQDVTDAVRDFAKELQRDWVVLNSLIGGGKCQLLFTISPVATPYSPHLSCNLPTVALPYPLSLHPTHLCSTLPVVALPYPLSLHVSHFRSTLPIAAPPCKSSLHPTHCRSTLPTVAPPYPPLLHPANRRSTLPTVDPPYPQWLPSTYSCFSLPLFISCHYFGVPFSEKCGIIGISF